MKSHKFCSKIIAFFIFLVLLMIINHNMLICSMTINLDKDAFNTNVNVTYLNMLNLTIMWKFKVNGTLLSVYSSVADINNDGIPEVIIFSGYDAIYIINGENGSLLLKYDLHVLPRYPAIADINNDEILEIIIGYKYGGSSGGILVLLSNLNVLWEFKGDEWFHIPAVADVNKDGSLDIIIGSENYVYVFNSNGEMIWRFPLESFIVSCPVLGNFDSDDFLEIVVCTRNGYVYLLDDDGKKLWEFKTGGIWLSSPAVGDIDEDGRLEIVIGSLDNYLYVINDDGTLLWKFCTNGDTRNPILGDVDNDEELEIIVGTMNFTYTNLYVLNGKDGTLLWNFTTGGSIPFSPLLADMNDDGFLDVIVYSMGGGGIKSFNRLHDEILVLDGRNGSVLLNISFEDVVSTPVLADLDGDKKLEMVLCTENYVYALDGFIGIFSSWNQFRGDLKRSVEISDWDLDGLSNEIEASINTSPRDMDSDNDHLLDGWEFVHGLNPCNPDSDGDGWNDGAEILYGTNPLDPSSFPKEIPPEKPQYSYVHWLFIFMLLLLSMLIILHLLKEKRRRN